MIAGVGISDSGINYIGWFIAFRDIARPTDQRTSIFTAIPSSCSEQ